ncbi:MAG: hypothetical protein EA424_26990 [Planctomycetaceae bacterium]|nr:MAG: hypothetical protein EA424_26990 [Planctomycetaceae bacterium]
MNVVEENADNLGQWFARYAKITRISGTASDGVERMIKSGRFNTKLYIRHLARRLGGEWQLEVIRRAQIKNEIWDIIATRIGD